MIHSFIFRIYRGVSNLRYWLERRLTPQGGVVLVGAAVTAGLGVNIEQSASYQAASLLVCFLLVGMVWAPFFRGNFECRRSLPRWATVGESVRYRVRIKNRGRRTCRGLLWRERLPDPRPNYREFKTSLQTQKRRSRKSFRFTTTPKRLRAARVAEHPLPELPPGEEVEVSTGLLPLKRGVLVLEGGCLSRPDPTGLFKGEVRWEGRDTLLVLPRRYPVPRLLLGGASCFQPSGVDHACSVGESEECIGLREYRRGDPPRHIHWKSWAKAGRPIIKEFQEETFVRHALILDNFTDETGPSLEEAVSVAASFACTLSTQESLLDLMFVGTEAFRFTAGRGLGSVEKMLEILASVRACPPDRFPELLRLVQGHAGVLSGCLAVFVGWDENRRELSKWLARAGVPLRVVAIAETASEARVWTDDAAGWLAGRFHALPVGQVAEGLAGLEAEG